MQGLIWGAGTYGKKCYYALKHVYGIRILGFIDSNSELWGEGLDGVCVIKPEDIERFSYDKIFVSPRKYVHIQQIVSELKRLGIEEKKIEIMEITHTYKNVYLDKRRKWIGEYAKYAYKSGINGNVAECGVYHGETAMFINEFFSDRTIYLFDTFEGFPSEDLEYELQMNNKAFNESIFALGAFNVDSSEQNIKIVLDRIPHPQNAVIRKGIFPDSAIDIRDEFSFVSLDMDLYQPMLAGMRFFWDKMVINGVILLHDYFHPDLPGVAQAVEAFEREKNCNIPKLPIGDGVSIALIKS